MRKHTRILSVVLLVAIGLAFNSLSERQASAAEDSPSVGLELLAEGFTAPVAMVEAPDGSGRLFIVDQVGVISILMPDGTLLDEPFLDLSSKIVTLNPNFDERGLLGLAFHPDYAENGRLFVYYSAPLRAGAPAGYNCTATISEFHVSDDPNQVDPASERILLEVDKPQFNHNGGTVAFGPDGNLYISIGDGGSAHDIGLGHVEDWYADNAGGNGQDITQNLLGNILRIDVDHGDPYAIPSDNPFVGQDGLDEIYAYGFRNPYRFSFDMGGGSMFAGDAGQSLWEEVSLVVKGGNYGWNVKEGTHCFDAENPGVSPATCPDTAPGGVPLRDPVIEYPNSNNPEGGLGAAVIGGYTYRGDDLPQFAGRYIFGDWSTEFGEPAGFLMVAKPRKSGLWRLQILTITTSPDGELHHYLLGFGQDLSGEMYVLTTDNAGPSGSTGRVYKLVSPSGK